MSSPPIPTDVQLYWPTLQAINALGGSATIREIEAKVAEIEGFSEDQLSVLHRGGPQTEINYRLAWARTYLKAAGALENSARGVWAITDEGRGLTEPDMQNVPPRARLALEESRRARKARREREDADELDGETADWRDQLLETLQSISPAGFERLAQRLLREAGFISVEVKGRSGVAASMVSACFGSP